MVVPLIPLAIGGASLVTGLFVGSKTGGDKISNTDNIQRTSSTLNTYQTTNTFIRDSKLNDIVIGQDSDQNAQTTAKQTSDQSSGLLTEQTLNYALILGGLYAGYKVYKEVF